MVVQGSGVIMTVTTLHSRTGLLLVGGLGPAMAAKEALTRDLSAELTPHGVRVVGLRPQAIPEATTTKEAFIPRAKAMGMTWEQFQELLGTRTHPRRLMTLEEMANVAVFIASEQASGMTGTTVNLTMGSLDDERRAASGRASLEEAGVRQTGDDGAFRPRSGRHHSRAGMYVSREMSDGCFAGHP
jgi:NAD(P)-dependent dehydrogenase (short-subunit alcohol dehydrogenase family)